MTLSQVYVKCSANAASPPPPHQVAAAKLSYKETLEQPLHSADPDISSYEMFGPAKGSVELAFVLPENLHLIVFLFCFAKYSR